MLQTQTVERETLELLKELMGDVRLGQFSLAEGTALALYMGHRKSIDLDLFSPACFDAPGMEKYLAERYGFRTDMLEKNTLKGSIGGVAVDMITHAYPTLRPFISEEGIRLYSREDIAAMKLSAIADSGTRLKDFIDVAYLSTVMPLADMVAAYGEKYRNSNPVRALKGLDYYADIIHDEHIKLLDGVYSWEHIRKRLADMISDPAKIFPDRPVQPERRIRPTVIPPKKPKKGFRR